MVISHLLYFQVIEKFIRKAHRQRSDGVNMTYESSTFMYAIAVSIFAIGGMCGGFIGKLKRNTKDQFGILTRILIKTLSENELSCVRAPDYGKSLIGFVD